MLPAKLLHAKACTQHALILHIAMILVPRSAPPQPQRKPGAAAAAPADPLLRSRSTAAARSSSSLVILLPVYSLDRLSTSKWGILPLPERATCSYDFVRLSVRLRLVLANGQMLDLAN
jgi:hypothetical protein